jgi:diadenosine tetraphosphate (Ap4A) HIT family hydrolase
MKNDYWKKDRINSAIEGTNPTVITRMKSGFVVLGDCQMLPGYCVLIAYPKVSKLTDLRVSERTTFLLDMSLIGQALESLYSPRRVNYSLEGSSDTFLKDPYLHAHVFPRYDWEQEDNRPYPVWRYPLDIWSEPKYSYNEIEHKDNKDKIKFELEKLMQNYY